MCYMLVLSKTVLSYLSIILTWWTKMNTYSLKSVTQRSVTLSVPWKLPDKRTNRRLPWNLLVSIKCHPCIPDEEVTRYSWQTFRLRCSVAWLKMLSVCATVEDHRGRHQMHPQVWASAGGRQSSGSASGAPQRLPVAPSERPQHCPVSLHPAVPSRQDHSRGAQPPAWDVVRKSVHRQGWFPSAEVSRSL